MLSIEKEIYNKFLKVSRTEQQRPYTYRRKFDGFEDHLDYPFVKKLGIFFMKFPQIKIEEFFRSPYRMYLDNSEYYDLKFYTSPKATRLYGVYIERLDAKCPDSDHHIKFIKQSLMFLFQFCRDNNLTFHEYTKHQTGDIKTVLLHIRDKKVSPYVIFGIADLGDMLKDYSNDFLDFTAGKNFAERVDLYRSRYYNSKSAKNIIVQGIDKLTKILTN